MNLGQLIKLERQRQNIKQEALAIGICVPSYLSRIENGLVIPSEDIKHHILMRLNISLDSLNGNRNEKKIVQFKIRFKQIVNSRDKKLAKELLSEIHLYIEEHPLDEERLTLLLLEARLMVMLPEVLDMKNNIHILKEFKKEMTIEQLFYLYTIQGITAYQDNQFSQASQIFKEVFQLIKGFRMDDWEMAELYYISGLSLLSESRYILAIDYVKEAISYFNQEILIERSIECLIILGIAQKNTGLLKEALATFERARDINSKIESSEFNGMIEHNLGSCYSLQKDSHQALQHFFYSLDAKHFPDDKVVTILSILKEYHKNGDIQNALVWLQKGLEISEHLSNSKKDLYTNHFSVYGAILLEKQEIIAIFKKALDYFSGKQDYKNCMIYYHVLAKRLAETKQYKQASIYYDLGFHFHLKQSKVSSWEELS
ncbi:helix-turn-helix domain-containing protein [Psychrobacillus psychrodurans]|uniref:helix-turn-helix domain-containing protein n=1 Tax=Psychrobacillus psychrodurans TaxID=126157 RepID=UPI001F4E677E|nr:helix-turn-helix domain-containing protein [Psychrobacillus psychrodurans]MCK1997184.1 helix-turn-helix domain-containing protein [Psychrobacillus psychrodurans]